jgi:transposase InsO family protein
VAVIDWASRAVLAWRLSNSMDSPFCVAALEEALARFGKPVIFNTDQGSQFTSTASLAAAGVKISMDGRGRWIDNVFIEHLWCSLKIRGHLSKHTPMVARPKPASPSGSPFTTSGRIKRWPTVRRWRPDAMASLGRSAKG